MYIPSGTEAGTKTGPKETVADVKRNLSKTKRDLTMKFLNILKRFQKNEDGAVTVDWVVLTAAVVGLGLVVMAAIRPQIETLSGEIATRIDQATPSATTTTP